MERKNDFSKGSTFKAICSMAIPMTAAQLVNILYNIVDRIYIGHMAADAMDSLTGLGLCMPIITMISAFASMFGMGGAPLCSIKRGEGDNAEAERIMGNAFTLLLGTGLLLTLGGLVFMRPILYRFGASNATYPFARAYLTIYLLGTEFVMMGVGMNSFINAQGFGKIGMCTVIIGAICNIVLDPLFIFVFHMGVQGAALATILSQAVSAAWILRFLCSNKAILRIRGSNMKLQGKRVGRITVMGLPSFIAGFTSSAVSAICNSVLRTWGGDIYVGIMTILHSVREIPENFMHGFTGGSQPVIGYNYGAKKYRRVFRCAMILSAISITMAVLFWLIVKLFPVPLIHLFNDDPQTVALAMPAMRIYFFFFFAFSLQYAGQSTFVALGKAKYSITFSLFRKVVLVVPLTLLLPNWFGLGVDGVFWAEALSQLIGSLACYITLIFVVLLPMWKAGRTENTAAAE